MTEIIKWLEAAGAVVAIMMLIYLIELALERLRIR